MGKTERIHPLGVSCKECKGQFDEIHLVEWNIIKRRFLFGDKHDLRLFDALFFP